MHILSITLVALSLISVPASATETRLLRMNSDTNDFVGNAEDYDITEPDGSFTIAGDSSVVLVRVDTEETTWTLDFVAPGRRRLAAGYYTGATRWPFNGPKPGLSIGGNGNGCDGSLGRFLVKQIEFDDQDKPRRFWAYFEHHCENSADALWGEVRFDALVGLDFQAPVRVNAPGYQPLSVPVSAAALDGSAVTLSAGILPEGVNFSDLGGGQGLLTWTPDRSQVGRYDISILGQSSGAHDSALVTILVRGDYLVALDSDPGYSVAQEEHLRYSLADGSITGSVRTDDGALIQLYRFPTLGLDFEFRAGGTPLAPGFYPAIRGFDDDDTKPVVEVRGKSSACEVTGGWLQVKDFALDGDGRLDRLWATFEHHCGTPNDPGPALIGDIRLNARASITVDPIHSRKVLVGHQIEIPVHASDPLGRSITLLARELPAGAVFTPGLDGSGLFQWTPRIEQAGDHILFFEGINSAGERDSAGAVVSVQGETSLTLHSMWSDGDAVKRFTPEDGEFTIESVGRSGISGRFHTPDESEFVTVTLTAPAGIDSLVPGIYDTSRDGARIVVVRTVPGQQTFCATGSEEHPVEGAFEIRALTWNAEGEPDQVYATFYAGCQHPEPWVRGELRQDARVRIDVATPVWSAFAAGREGSFEITATDFDGRPLELSVHELPEGASFEDLGGNRGILRWRPAGRQIGGHSFRFEARASNGDVGVGSTWVEVTGETWFRVTSGPDDPVGGGAEHYFEAPDADFTSFVTLDRTLLITVGRGDEGWYFNFAAPNGAPLSEGTYLDAGRIGAGRTTEMPGLLIASGDSCHTSYGNFTVHTLRFGAFHNLESAVISFDQHCGEDTGGLSGVLFVNASPDMLPSGTVTDFTATNRDGQIELRWEVDNLYSFLGFDIWRRSASSEWTRINSEVVSGALRFEYIDMNPPSGSSVMYQLEAIDRAGSRNRLDPISIDIPYVQAPEILLPRNPVRTSIHLRFALPISGPVGLSVFDVAGRRVAEIVDRTLEAGWHDAEWDLTDEGGRRVNSGIYFLSLKSTAGDKSRSVLVIR